ncbi:hypothetical protein EHQ27_02605 [Leptospira wolffii]|uniref:hypothetical protein n=1 Tax=Leptospira wolffii TaxID=409998 RepID=UPI001082A567|nr:hypothetical protein [Leptospira wolffii]TGK64766.1 hypothetical protein EHQ32_00675 [Leptospira wolffii]TGK76835.1 hypothetical protein EHQ35_00540 [Leptospira wolffii]TGK77313.1 hypothetical protein EHQ27_02605 [Leptospira wolffii]TGL26708.1 hypothetical protein EHQ57_18510 [Leptospira wolffii]
MRRMASVLFFLAYPVLAENLPTPFSAGFSFSTYDSRFFRKSTETVWLRGEFCPKEPDSSECQKHKVFFEKRGESPLLSYAFENSFLYFSYGNRFRPLKHFFFLRETFDFSSFWFLEQPTVRTGFLGLKLGQSHFGAYYSDSGAEKRPGFFLKPFKDYMELAYSPETKEGFLLLEYPSTEEQRSQKKRFGFKMEAFGTGENPQGLVSAYWKEPENNRRIFLTGYRGRSGQLFQLGESVASEEKASLFRLVWEPAPYSQIQIAQSERISPEGRILYTAKSFLGKASLFEFPFFALVAQARAYHFSNEEPWVWGKGFFLAYQKRGWKWEVGQEWRRNGDRITEAGLQITVAQDWKIYSALVYSEERNLLPSFAEESITPEETGLVVTDKTFYSLLRIFHPYFAVHLRHSRDKGGRGDGLSVRFQVFLPLGD